jgi:hypothetical protein
MKKKNINTTNCETIISIQQIVYVETTDLHIIVSFSLVKFSPSKFKKLLLLAYITLYVIQYIHTI